MAAHRYWRIRFLVPASGNRAAGGIEMRTAVSGANVCSGGTAIASSSWNSGSNPPSAVFDADPNTWWASASEGAGVPWIGYDFGAGNAKDIVEIKYWARNDGTWEPGQALRIGVVEASDDNATWTTQWYILDPTAWSSGNIATPRIYTSQRAVTAPDRTASYQHWRLQIWCVGSYAMDQTSMRDVEFHSSEGGADILTGGTASSSSNYAGVTANYAIDDDSGPANSDAAAGSTYWASTATAAPHWWRYSFAYSVVVREVNIRCRYVQSSQAPTVFSLEYSSDGTTWYEAYTWNNPSWNGNTAETRTFNGTGLPSVSITGITPSSGSALGGTNVTISGSGFTSGVSGAAVGGVALTNFTIVNDTVITGTTGRHSAGLVNVTAGTGLLPSAFRYGMIIDPNHGSLGGGNRVRVKGFRT